MRKCGRMSMQEAHKERKRSKSSLTGTKCEVHNVQVFTYVK